MPFLPVLLNSGFQCVAEVIADHNLLDPLDQDPLDLVQTDGIVGAVVQLGRARRFAAGPPGGWLAIY
jgi:hypothetical protein